MLQIIIYYNLTEYIVYSKLYTVNHMNTKYRILEFIVQRDKARVEDLRLKFQISRAMIHKHLLNLQKEDLVFKSGKPPIVYYTTKKSNVSAIDRILERIKLYKPEKVILFGSQAYGIPDKDSDYDIAIIKNTDKSYRERLIDVRKLVRVTIPIDFFVFNQSEIDKYKNSNPIIKEILTKGKVIYG